MVFGGRCGKPRSLRFPSSGGRGLCVHGSGGVHSPSRRTGSAARAGQGTDAGTGGCAPRARRICLTGRSVVSGPVICRREAARDGSHESGFPVRVGAVLRIESPFRSSFVGIMHETVEKSHQLPRLAQRRRGRNRRRHQPNDCATSLRVPANTTNTRNRSSATGDNAGTAPQYRPLKKLSDSTHIRNSSLSGAHSEESCMLRCRRLRRFVRSCGSAPDNAVSSKRSVHRLRKFANDGGTGPVRRRFVGCGSSSSTPNQGLLGAAPEELFDLSKRSRAWWVGRAAAAAC